MQLTLCVPVLNRYDLLRRLLLSLEGSTVRPTAVYLIDNGRDNVALCSAISEIPLPQTEIFTPSANLGVAASWNVFIREVGEERLIVNDDIVLGPTSIQQMVETPGDIVTGLLRTNACSCFIIRDSCVRKIGLFDEDISPGYAYFEDCDYAFRLAQEGQDFIGVECGVEHTGSQTLSAMTPMEVRAHHRKYVVAQNNFLRKWGRLPPGFERQYA